MMDSSTLPWWSYKEFIASLYPEHALSQVAVAWFSPTPHHPSPQVASKTWQLAEAMGYQKYLPARQILIWGICQLVLESRGRHPSGWCCPIHLQAHSNPYRKLEDYYLETEIIESIIWLYPKEQSEPSGPDKELPLSPAPRPIITCSPGPIAY